MVYILYVGKKSAGTSKISYTRFSQFIGKPWPAQNTWWGGVSGIADELYLKLNNQKMVSEEETKPKLAILLHKFLLKESAYGLNRVETI